MEEKGWLVKQGGGHFLGAIQAEKGPRFSPVVHFGFLRSKKEELGYFCLHKSIPCFKRIEGGQRALLLLVLSCPHGAFCKFPV
jgi:hypothetical protein